MSFLLEIDLHAYTFPVAFSTASLVVPNCPLPSTFPSEYMDVTSCQER